MGTRGVAGVLAVLEVTGFSGVLVNARLAPAYFFPA
jgi:hypothetical protein